MNTTAKSRSASAAVAGWTAKRALLAASALVAAAALWSEAAVP